MTDNSFKREFEAEAKASSKRRRNTLIVSAVVVLAGCVGTVAWAQSRPNEPAKTEARSVTYESFDEAENQPKDEPERQTQQATSNAASAPQSNQAQTTPHTYAPAPQSINKAAFISDGKAVLSAYNQIVGLVTFSSSMSDDEKASRIKQAVSLDKQSTGKVTNLRGHLVWANISSGPYMNATELAESGISKLSVGLTFMNFWADNRSRTSDLQGGLGEVTQGSNILIQFSQKLNAL